MDVDVFRGARVLRSLRPLSGPAQIVAFVLVFAGSLAIALVAWTFALGVVLYAVLWALGAT